MFIKSSFAAAAALVSIVKADYDATNMPAKTDPSHGQVGFNDCITRYGASSAKSLCQTSYINSVQDFCLWAPRTVASIGDQEANVVSYCTKSGYGTRLIPDGTIKGVQFVKTPSFVEVKGNCDCTKINIPRGDEGGELDPHGATGAGNPVGGVVFTRAFSGNGAYEQIHEWNNFMAYNEFSFRACRGTGTNARRYCPHIYDLQGSHWNSPGKYENGNFEQCDGLEGNPPGRYPKNGTTSVFHQGDGSNPPPQAPGATSNCRKYATISQGPAASPPVPKKTTTKAASTSTKSSTSSASKTATASKKRMVAEGSSAPVVRRHHAHHMGH
ncbi:hypothetical protein V8E36_008475 [Tilletia maclaganii]